MVEDSTSSSPDATSAWARWLMPSVADLIFVALLATLLFTPLSGKLLGDAGIGWHIRTGQLILANHAVPRADPFSSSMAGKPWFAWEWLYDVAAGESRAGLNGVVWLTAVVIAAVFASAFRMLLRRGANLAVALMLVLLALSASMIHFLARPHVVSWLFTLVWFGVLDSIEKDSLSGRRGGFEQYRVWILPPMMLVWVNVHGGFLVGFLLLAIFWLSAVWTLLATDDHRIEEVFQKIAARKRALSLLWVGLLSLAASFVNPYGWKLHAHIYSYLSNQFLMNHIEEFQSPNFHGVAQKCFLALVLIILAVLASCGRKSHKNALHASGLLIILFAVYSGLYAARNIPVSSLLLVLVVAPLISEKTISGKTSTRQFLNRMQQVELNLRGHLWPMAAVVLTFFVAANGGRIGASAIMNAHFDSKRMPVEAVNYIQENHVQGPIFSPDLWGGYLIYRLYPNQRVIVDDRHDFYGPEFLKSYLKSIHVESGWQDFIQQHSPSCILLPRDSALANVLIETRDWKAIYMDDVAVLFVRSRP